VRARDYAKLYWSTCPVLFRPNTGDKSKFLVFGKRARRFKQNVFFCSGLCYRSAGDVACKRPVRPIIVFFFYCSYCSTYLSFVSSSVARFPFIFEFSFFFGKRDEARGNRPADRHRKLASRTISDFAFGSPFFLNFFIQFPFKGGTHEQTCLSYMYARTCLSKSASNTTDLHTIKHVLRHHSLDQRWPTFLFSSATLFY
jgi:hypothetical protein